MAQDSKLGKDGKAKKSILTRIAVASVLLLLSCYGLFLSYYLPKTIRVRATGIQTVETTIRETDGSSKNFHQEFPEFIEIGSTTPRRFRNEPTGYGWPFYFKLDDNSLAKDVQDAAFDRSEQIYRLRYYGWNLPLDLMRPNAVSLTAIPADASDFPYFNSGVALLHLIALIAVVFRGRKTKKNKIPEKSTPAGSVPSASKAEPPASAANAPAPGATSEESDNTQTASADPSTKKTP